MFLFLMLSQYSHITGCTQFRVRFFYHDFDFNKYMGKISIGKRDE
jgi:hypothetical protein